MSERTGHVPLPELLAQLETDHDIEPLRSRTAEMFIARPHPGTEGPALLVKHCEAKHVPSAEAAYRAQVRCDAAGRQDGTRFVPAPECWGADPPYVCTEFIDSRRFADVFMPLATGRTDDIAEMRGLAAQAGATLARFHRALSLDERTEQGPVHRPKLHWLARRLVHARRRSDETHVHLHTDFGPQNLILDPSDEMLIVDLPGSDRIGVPEEDLGRFIESMTRRFRSRPRLATAVVDAVLDGYASTSGINVRTGDRRALVESFAARHGVLIAIDGLRRLSRVRTRQGTRSIAAARRRARANR